MIKDNDSKFEELAKSLLFTGGPKDSNDVQTLIEKLGLQYRKGKSFIDVKHAATKALKNGNYRTERQLPRPKGRGLSRNV